MKIGVTSDLHIDAAPLNKQILPHIVKAAEKAALDIFILAGDLSSNLLELAETLIVFTESNLNCPKLFVPGNHDIWVVEHPDVTSDQKHEAITTICRECDFHPLDAAPFVKNGVGFCGTIGWYDYSFGDNEYNFSEAAYASKQLFGSVWNDSHFAKWNGTDPEIAQRFENRLRDQIRSVKDSVSQIIVTTHHVPFRECVRSHGAPSRDFFNAYMGSQGLGKICLEEPLVTHSLFGHIHVPICQQIGDVTTICSPIGYLHQPPAADLSSYAQERLTCFEL